MAPNGEEDESSPSTVCHPLETLRVLRIAAASRIAVVTLIVFWILLASPYDTSAPLNPPCLFLDSGGIEASPTPPVRWPNIGKAIEDSIVWDGVYFVRIAECGYEYEQSYAFLPLFPLCISFLARTVFVPVVPLLGYRAVLGLSAYVLNNLVFCLASIYFYWLSCTVLMDSRNTFRASVLFCFNPASIFYSSIYSESLYALLSFGGLYYLVHRNSKKSIVFFALSGAARSNGFLNVGYFCFQTLHRAFAVRKRIGLVLQIIFGTFLQCLVVFVPFISFQAYGFYNICRRNPSQELRPWCKSQVPYLYGFIQSHYWGVGFLKYFQLKQIPNFLLASPVLSLALFSIIKYAKSHRNVMLSLGFTPQTDDILFHSAGPSKAYVDIHSQDNNFPKISMNAIRRRQKRKTDKVAADDNDSYFEESTHHLTFDPIVVLPFIFHLVFLVAVAFFVMHVQVATRFLSPSPPIYWFASQLASSAGVGWRWSYFIWVYFLSYILLGSLLFSNFYPFT